MFAFITEHWEGILLTILAAETLAQNIVKLTPSTKDDEIVQKVIDTLNGLGVKPKQ